MALNTQSYTSLVTNFATTVQGYATNLVDFTIGSVLRAIDEAVAYVALWLQGLALQVGALTRAATSNGTDLDSWFAQFGFSRLPAVVASGQVTFARFTPTNSAVIPIGATVQSADGLIQFLTVVDTTNVNYSAALNGYNLPAGISSISVTVNCTVVGTIGNVLASQINTLGSAIAGVDYVSNAAAFTNGVAAETDPAARARFVLWIASLGTATLLAVQNAIEGVGQGVTGVIIENTQYNGSTQYGYFTVIADNGTGYPPSNVLNAVGSAVEAARPLTVTYGVHAPTVLTATVSMTITTASGYVHSTVTTLVAAAIQSYINGLGDDVNLPWSMLATTAYTVAGVTNVTDVLLNGGTSDMTATNQQRILAGTITVS